MFCLNLGVWIFHLILFSLLHGESQPPVKSWGLFPTQTPPLTFCADHESDHGLSNLKGSRDSLN